MRIELVGKTVGAGCGIIDALQVNAKLEGFKVGNTDGIRLGDMVAINVALGDSAVRPGSFVGSVEGRTDDIALRDGLGVIDIFGLFWSCHLRDV